MDVEVLNLSTLNLRDGDRSEVIREYYGKIAQRMEIEPEVDAAFHMDVSAMLLPGLMLGRGAVGAVKATRSAAMRADGSDDIVLSFQRQGSVVIDGGTETVVQPGAVAVTALDRPITLHMREFTNRFLTLQISRRALAPLVASSDALTTRSLTIEQPALGLLATYADGISARDLATPQLRDVSARHLIELAALALGSNQDGREQAAGGLRAARLAAAKAAIAKNLDSPRLSARTVAAELGVSPRYLHMLFEGEAQSFAGFVTEQRLARAMRALSDPSQRHRRILQIALQAGFGDISTFNRAFRKRFGKTPSDCRSAEPGRTVAPR